MNVRTCLSCKESFPATVEYFYRRRTRGKVYGFFSDCKTCHNKISAGRVALHRKGVKARLMELKGNRCADCGMSADGVLPDIFEFDHREPGKKAFSLSNHGLTANINLVLAEAEKCDLVCANCHRLRTHRQRCGKTECEFCPEGELIQFA